MRLQNLMAAVKKGSSSVLERVPSAAPGVRNKPKGTPVRALHPNSSPIYKTQSDTSLTTGIRNLSIKDNKGKDGPIKRVLSGRAGDRSGVKSVSDAAGLLQSENIQNIVVVAGAGISTPSGIPDFRSPGTGLYDNLQQYQIPYPEAIFDIDYFHQNPRPFFTLAKELYPSGKWRPNYIHYFIRLLHDKGMLLRMYTQNIDGLERLAGIPADKLVEAHGTFATATCTNCKHKMNGADIKDKIFADKLPRCPTRGCIGIAKPDIVFFGEDLPRKFYSYMKDMLQADMVLVMGTSLEVQPFAGIIDTVRYNVPRILFNREAVGPFKYGRRSQDLVAAGDLIDQMVKFATTTGWKSDMVDLITREEGEFKIINQKPPQSPQKPSKEKNYSNILYRQSAKIGMFGNDSSSEESTDSDSDVTSSDSSEEEIRNRRYRGPQRGTTLNNSRNKNGAANRNFRSSSAKLSDTSTNNRKFHTEANSKSNKNVNGSLTGRSVKSESGVNVNLAKRRLDNSKKPSSVAGDNDLVRNGSDKVKNTSVSKTERDRVLRKYGLSPKPAVQHSESNDSITSPPKTRTAFENEKENGVNKLPAPQHTNSFENEKENGVNKLPATQHTNSFENEKQIGLKKSPVVENNQISKTIVSNALVNDTNLDVINSTALEKRNETIEDSINENNQVVNSLHNKTTISSEAVKIPFVNKEYEMQGLKNLRKPVDSTADTKGFANGDFQNEHKATEMVTAVQRYGNQDAPFKPDPLLGSLARENCSIKTEDFHRQHYDKVMNMLENKSGGDTERSVVSPDKIINSVIRTRKSSVQSNPEKSLKLERSDSALVSGYFIDDTSKSLTNEKENKKGVQVYKVNGTIDRDSMYENSRKLTEKAAKSFARYAKLNAQRRVKGQNGDNKKQTSNGKTKSKPPSGAKNRSETVELRALNARPYGYTFRRGTSVKGVGPFHRINVRTLNSQIDHTQDPGRSGSAELPKISYKHNVQPVQPYKLGGLSGGRPTSTFDTGSEDGSYDGSR